MTVRELREALEKLEQDAVVAYPNEVGWSEVRDIEKCKNLWKLKQHEGGSYCGNLDDYRREDDDEKVPVAYVFYDYEQQYTDD